MDGCVSKSQFPLGAADVIAPQLTKAAIIAGTNPEMLVKSAALRLADDVQFRAAVREGIAQADRGEFIEEEEMDTRFEKMLRS